MVDRTGRGLDLRVKLPRKHFGECLLVIEFIHRRRRRHHYYHHHRHRRRRRRHHHHHHHHF